ncbi:nucleotide exchange factor GrpE [Streptosporangium longisporum]|uniref:Nucleotide exchange factor GrpE n=1 Tax=Streptosporangium longisporum TaxID=46187 RepID=A0ABP6L5B1_9ACTN
MRDRGALLALPLLAWPVLTGCAAATGSGAGAGGASPAPSRGGVLPLRPEPAGPGTRPGTELGTGPGTVETPFGSLPLPLPLPLTLVAAAVVLAAVAAGLYLWHRWHRGRPAPLPASPPSFVPAPDGRRAGDVPAGRGPGTAPFPGTAPVAPVPAADGAGGAGGAGGLGGVAGPGSGPLVDALHEVAGSGISPALAQQVDRLLAGGDPGREALVAACVGYRDQLAERHPRLAGTLLDGLARAGVREVVADGLRFDPRLHEASGTAPAPRPDLHDLVAETVRCGYADGERVIRVPRVVVYRSPGTGAER